VAASRRQRRPPVALTLSALLFFLELTVYLREAIHSHPHGIPAVLAALAFFVSVLTFLIVLFNPHRWALGVIVAAWGAVTARVLYRGIRDDPVHLVGLIAVAVALALLALPSSRRFYRGEWHVT